MRNVINTAGVRFEIRYPVLHILLIASVKAPQKKLFHSLVSLRCQMFSNTTQSFFGGFLGAKEQKGFPFDGYG
jgi:hypothetical protein